MKKQHQTTEERNHDTETESTEGTQRAALDAAAGVGGTPRGAEAGLSEDDGHEGEIPDLNWADHQAFAKSLLVSIPALGRMLKDHAGNLYLEQVKLAHLQYAFERGALEMRASRALVASRVRQEAEAAGTGGRKPTEAMVNELVDSNPTILKGEVELLRIKLAVDLQKACRDARLGRLRTIEAVTGLVKVIHFVTP